MSAADDSLSFSDFHFAVSASALFLQAGEILLQPLQAVLRGGVLSFFKRLLLDLHAHNLAVEIVELLRLGIDLHAQPRRRLVDQIDRLVGQEAVGDVAVRQGRRGDQRAVGDPHLVVRFVFFLQAAQDRDGVLDRRLVDIDRLEAPRQGGILLDMLLVFIERGGADAMQFAARQRRLEQVGGVHRAVGLAGTDDGVHLVDEQHVGAGRAGHFREHGFEPLLELAAIFGAGNQRAHVEREKLLVLQALRHVAVDDAQRQALDDGGLADAGFADQHRIVLGAPRQHLDGAADFLVAADHRIELAVARGLGQVAGIFLQRIVGVLGRRRVGGAAFAQGFDRRVEVLRRNPGIGQNLSGVAALVRRQRQQQPFDGDIAVAGLLAGLLGGIEDARQSRVEIDLPGPAAGNLRPLGKRRFGRRQRGARIAAGAIDQARGEPFRVVEQNLEQMLGCELLMSLALRERLGGLNETAAAVGIFLEIHFSLCQAALPRPIPATL